jgi:hypothetical protein
MPGDLITNCFYVDTCVFEYRRFDFSGAAFASLLALAKDGHARMLTSSVTVGECHNHIAAHVSRALSVRKKFAAEAFILRRFNEYAVLFAKPEKDALTGRVIAEFDQYLSLAKAEHVDLDLASVTGIVDQYFNQRPPFGTGDKKAEFPDAIVLSALTGWCQRNNACVYVITRDEQMRAACTEDRRLYALADVTDFLDLVNSRRAVAADLIRAIFHARAGLLLEEILDERFDDLPFAVEGLYADVDVLSVERLDFGEPEIVSVNAHEATIEVTCEVAFTAEVTYEDEDTGFYDFEAMLTRLMDTVKRKVNHTTDIRVEVLFEYESLASLANLDDVAVSVMRISRQQPIMLKIYPNK